MAHYLVTGGLGFIGSHLADRLIRDGHLVTILDNLSTGSFDNKPPKANVIVGDITNPDQVHTACEGIDGIFHLAAVASVQRSREEWARTHQSNLTGTVHLLEAARHAGHGGRAVPVVYASSAAVYGDNPAIPLGEQATPHPLSAYGADKLGCELHANVAWGIHGVPTVGFRFFNVYGPRQDPSSPYSGVISIFARKVANSETVDIFGDGQQVRDFVYVGDVVNFLTRSMQEQTTGAQVFNLCTGRPTSLLMLLETLADLSGGKPASRRHLPPRDGDIRVSIGDPARLKAAFGHGCRVGLLDGLGATLASSGVAVRSDGRAGSRMSA